MDDALGSRLVDGRDRMLKALFGELGVLLFNGFKVALYSGLNGALDVPIPYPALFALNHPFYG